MAAYGNGLWSSVDVTYHRLVYHPPQSVPNFFSLEQRLGNQYMWGTLKGGSLLLQSLMAVPLGQKAATLCTSLYIKKAQ